VRRLDLPRRANGDGPPPLAIDLASTSRPEAIRTIIAAFLDETIPDDRWFLETLADRAKVALDDGSMGRDLFASWDLVRRLTEPGGRLSVGSHGHSHRRLARLDADGQRSELAGSKRILEERLGCEVDALAYPYGWPGAYTPETKALAAEAGYRAAFAAVEGINRPGAFDPFEVRRLNVGSGDTATLLRARAALHAAIGRSFL
jgi:peptidoglycan/xylan/chitin deacetylase (PgdA/CDA1 family)